MRRKIKGGGRKLSVRVRTNGMTTSGEQHNTICFLDFKEDDKGVILEGQVRKCYHH